MRNETMGILLENIFDQIREVRGQGNKEYAHGEIDNVFNNFERVAHYVGITREQVLLVYMLKHIDGIAAHIKGHKSQREPVTGRIKDAMTYLALFWGMETEEAKTVDIAEVARYIDDREKSELERTIIKEYDEIPRLQEKEVYPNRTPRDEIG